MNKLFAPRLPNLPPNADDGTREFYRAMTQWGRDVAAQVNKLSEGRISGHYNADTATPTSTVVKYNQGDFVWNKAPQEITATASSYMVLGWSNEIAGSPGTWREVRVKTGN